MALRLSENALKVLQRRYLRKDEEGRIVETPDEMFHRVADAIASAELLYGASEAEVKKLREQFYEIMISFEFLPNSPCLMPLREAL